MKNIFCVIFLFTLSSLIYCQSGITYDAGTGIDVSTGADICADAIILNGLWSGGGTICSGALPVSVSSFTSSVYKRDVTLLWVTEWEINNLGFRIEKLRIDENVWKEIGFVEGHGTVNTANGYIFKDEKTKAGLYQYRLKQIDYNGNYEYFSPSTGDVVINSPNNFEVSQNYPNPSNPKSKIDFQMPFDGKVSIKVYDIAGREVAVLIDGLKPADFYSVEFDGSNLASGVYFYRIIADGEGKSFTKTLKMVLVK